GDLVSDLERGGGPGRAEQQAGDDDDEHGKGSDAPHGRVSSTVRNLRDSTPTRRTPGPPFLPSTWPGGTPGRSGSIGGAGCGLGCDGLSCPALRAELSRRATTSGEPGGFCHRLTRLSIAGRAPSRRPAGGGGGGGR